MFKVLASVFKMCVGLYINRKIAGPKMYILNTQLNNIMRKY